MMTQLKKGALELCILSLLIRRDYYGFELVAAIPQEIEMSEGTVYPLLKRLRDDGLLTTYWKESSGGPPRKYYRISPKGNDAYVAMRTQWETFSGAVNRLLNT
ncbi:MAG: PadR family transcriptional regulator [Oscillospiraceae bacterium]|nr:PadR family transcriptional regulator [Oscillospiraceae bacterium]